MVVSHCASNPAVEIRRSLSGSQLILRPARPRTRRLPNRPGGRARSRNNRANCVYTCAAFGSKASDHSISPRHQAGGDLKARDGCLGVTRCRPKTPAWPKIGWSPVGRSSGRQSHPVPEPSGCGLAPYLQRGGRKHHHLAVPAQPDPGAVPTGSITCDPAESWPVCGGGAYGVEVGGFSWRDFAPSTQPGDVGDLFSSSSSSTSSYAIARHLDGHIVGGRPRPLVVHTLLSHESQLCLDVERTVAADRDINANSMNTARKAT